MFMSLTTFLFVGILMLINETISLLQSLDASHG